jgi:nucleoside-diphosphate-sugar epimerase
MRVLVTGATGFIGHHIVRDLLKRGEQVRALVHTPTKIDERLGKPRPTLEIVVGDIINPDTINNFITGVDAIIHLAAIPLEKGKQTYEEVNHQGTVNLVNAAVKAGVKRFIHCSQNSANPQSFSPFIRSKSKSNIVVETAPLDWTMLHPSLVFGPYDTVFSTLARMIRLMPVVFPLPNGGKAEYQPTSVYDLVDATIACLYDDTTIHQHYNFGGLEILTFKTMVQRVLDAMETRRLLFPMPIALMKPPVFLMHHLLPQPPMSITQLNLLTVPNVVLHKNDYDRFGITPRPFAGDNLLYLRDITSKNAVQTFLGRVSA